MELNDLLTKTIESGASDLHICAGVPPVIRVSGDLIYLNEPILTPHDCVHLAKQCLNNRLYETFLEKGEVDASYSVPGVARFRINVFKQRATCAIALRSIPTDIPVIEDLGLPGLVYDLSLKQRGLILITGPTGHGKSTTLAAMLNYINSKRKCHIVTIEDPIEFLHRHNKSVINQREIGADTVCYPNAMRAVLREDPDVILIGEMRDQETIATALTAAETGHLVLSTLHTIGSAKTIDRIIDVFPPHQQAQVRTQLSTVLRGIISQQLIQKADGKGRVLATESMVWTPAIANLIRESRTHQINTCIQTGSQFGMYTMDSCLSDLYKQELIDYESACQYAIDLDNLRKIISM
ncbi:type IV pilus twitching motility protein PilT [Herbivorax sp. ANBcel31]|uniref:type IV pilus twitching motility protein PilT n=1 Tax=Herbivorax sp. ANBcel31 TaxID=3069754 RepID=UPI0027B59A9E|nr:type IV pilus twitching motility protein PilT [Herbivorax sp. ANBcel31]MDQ2085844.1 type IV pilus twitching motility protein PilT [Herbivorax sp. ANBcel31]